MIALAAVVAIMATGLFAVQVLRSVDLPKYRALIFKIYAALALLGAGAAAYGASGAPRGTALIAVGSAGLLLFGQRAWHYHALRREIDIPPHLVSTYDPKLEGPSAQAAKRKAGRVAPGGEAPPAA